MTFADIIEQAAKHVGTKDALAKKIGISATRISRVANDASQHTLNVENCLRLAEITGIPPSDILRVAGKQEVADLIERLYGQGADHDEIDGAFISHSKLETIFDCVTSIVQALPERRRTPIAIGTITPTPERPTKNVRRQAPRTRTA
jgi:transcriptional regulator with XRE-family HTH domain